MSDWQSLFRRGKLLEADRALDPRRLLSDSEAVERAELLYLLGIHSQARVIVDGLLARKDSSVAIRSKAALVRSCCYYDDGLFEASVRESQRALELAEQAKDWPVAALAVSYLIERRSLTTVLDHALPLVPLARRYAARSGDPQVLAQVHLVFGRVEGRVGCFERALRHVAIARSLLERDPNTWLDAAVHLCEASVTSLLGDSLAALELAKGGQQLAEASGWSKGTAVAAANVANFCVLLGQIDEAEKVLQCADAVFAQHPTYQIAVAETRAQAAISHRDWKGALNILRATRSIVAPNLKWYQVSCRLTESRVLLALQRWRDSADCASEGLRWAEDSASHPAAIALKLCLAEARIGLRESIDISSLEVDLPFAPLELLAGCRHTKAKALQAGGRVQRAAAYRLACARILGSTGVLPPLASADQDVGTIPSPTLPPPNLDSAVTLLDLAGHPHVLAREAFAVIEGADCTHAVALVTSGPGGARVIEQRGWDHAHAIGALETKPEGVEILPLGRYRDDAWQIVARPKADIDAYCTFAAIRKILAAAVALDQYRRDEKQRAALWPADALDGDPDSIWASEQMAETLAVARRIAPTPLSILLTGETGTGKEMLARAIHRASDRADRPFLPFNCTAVPRDMLESQLFGYRRGAFTGADASFAGVIRAAAGGTLFLDEIADLTLEVQPKLLRFLETREVHPLGESHPVTVDVRIVAATNASLEKLVAEGRFREDLFYRLNVVRLKLPPLRERREEIPPLVYHYLRRFGDEQRKGRLTLSDETLEYLLLFSWPGNVRQLANEIRRIVALVEPDATITPAMLSPDIQASRRTIPAATTADAEVRLTLDQPLPAAVQLLEQMMVRRALDRAHGKVEEASRILGISRKGLFLKRRRLGLRHAS